MNEVTPEQLLAEIEDAIRTMPPRATIRHENRENIEWLGRASAVIRLWDPQKAIIFDGHVSNAHHMMANVAAQGLRGLQTLLYQAAHELRMKTVGPLTVAIGQGGVFDYFDEVRKVIESAKIEVFFVDPYLDAEFVSRYLPHVTEGVNVRLLGREYMGKLLPAVSLLRDQTGLTIEVRAIDGMHDRYVFVDRSSCYQSGASFKDGAKKAATTLTQIVDAFGAVFDNYEKAWNSAAVR